MSNITNLHFAALKTSGENYLQWALDAKIHLKSKGLGDCIENNENDDTNDYRAISIIRHHLTEGLKNQYLTIESPLDLWNALKSRYDHQRTVLLPRAQFEWKNLRIQDFKSVEEYNSALFRIVSILKLCGEEVSERDLLEKTFSTFHSNNILLQQQYREKGFKTYADLISCLLLAEQNNELLMMNSAMRPPGSAPTPEANKVEKNVTEANYIQRNTYSGRGRGRWNGRGGGHSFGRGSSRGGRGFGREIHDQGRGYNRYNFDHGRGRGRGRGISKPQHSTKPSSCHRCGVTNHWAKNCRTPRHLCDLYQESLKKNPEVNLVHHDDQGDFDHENDDLMEYETSDCLKENI